VRFLASRGASLVLKDKQAHTALDVAGGVAGGGGGRGGGRGGGPPAAAHDSTVSLLKQLIAK